VFPWLFMVCLIRAHLSNQDETNVISCSISTNERILQ